MWILNVQDAVHAQGVLFILLARVRTSQYSFTHFVLVLFTWFYKEWKDAWKPSEERTNVVNEYSEWVSEMKVVSEVNAQILLLRP